MTQISDFQQNVRNAMYWPEHGKEVFHNDAFNFGKSLRPLLWNESASSMGNLVKMLKSYESYRSDKRRVMQPLYKNRYRYIKHLNEESNQYLDLFRDPKEVLDLVEKQRAAHQKAMTSQSGWQDAMKAAGIWDDDKEKF